MTSFIIKQPIRLNIDFILKISIKYEQIQKIYVMKKGIMIIVVMGMALGISAQQLDLGMSFIPAASTVNFDMENMEVSTTLLAQVCFSTESTYHVIGYNFNGTSVLTLHGWMYADNQDTYIIVAKNLKDAEGYIGIGWEHAICNGNFTPSAFVEVGTNYAFSESYFSIGIFAPLNWKVWEKKKKTE